MPVGSFQNFNKFKERLLRASNSGNTVNIFHSWKAAFLDSSWTPDLASQTGIANCVDAEISNSDGTSIRQTLANIAWALSAGNTFKCTADDLTVSSTALMPIKYVVVFDSDTTDNILVGYYDTNSGTTTGVSVNELRVQWPSSKLFTMSGGTAG